MTYWREKQIDTYWPAFLDWLDGASFDPRNGEHIETIFWYWYLKVLNEGNDKPFTARAK